MPTTNHTSDSPVLWRTRRSLLAQTSLSCTYRSITSLGYTCSSRVISTCSHTLSSISICRNLYIRKLLWFFCFLVLCQIWGFLVFSFPLLTLSEMYWAQGPLPSSTLPPVPTREQN